MMNMQAENELKPCPFCGGKALVEERHHNDGITKWITYRVRCDSGCGAIVGVERTPKEAITAWNRRKE
jgi:Lar family restriction alleviation protein